MISMGNDVKFARFVLLAVSDEAKIWLSGLLRWPTLTGQDIGKIVGDKDSQNTKRSTKVAKELFADFVKEKKLREPVYRYIYTFRNKLSVPLTVATIVFFCQCIIKQLLDSVFVISRIIKVSVRVISLSLRLRRITPISTLIILDITKTSSNNCLILLLLLLSSLLLL